MKQRNLIWIDLAQCLWRLAYCLHKLGSVPIIGNRTYGLHQFYSVHCNIFRWLPTVISAISNSGYCVPPCLLFKMLHPTHTVYLSVLFKPHNKQEKFPYTAVICWFLQHISRDFGVVKQNLYICIYFSSVSFPKWQCHGSDCYFLMSDGRLSQILYKCA
jgi:hypothetical protein